MMPAWSRVQGLNQSEAFTRPLGLLESVLYWDTVCSGITDSEVYPFWGIPSDTNLNFVKAVEQLTLETPTSESPSLGLFSPQNVERAWLSTKKLHPLLGARFHEQPDASGVNFVVDEAHLNMIASNEIIFTTLQSDEEACSLVDDILNGPRRLSNEQLVQLWIISFPRCQSGSSSSTCYQLLLHMAHSILDAVAQNTIIRVFFDLLVHPSTPEMYNPKGSLESRLMMHLAIDDLYPSLKLSLARRRWRLAIARVMYSRKVAAWKGGHTLPHTLTPLTLQTPPISRTLRLQLSKELSRRVLRTCRQAGITFGHALHVLSQLAHAKVLHRLYAQGLLSKTDWADRITQPMHQSGPINLRAYLDQEWLATGGADRVCMATSYFRSTLPTFPVARSPRDSSRVLENPPFDALLSGARFFYRCRMVKEQASDFLSHPLLPEFAQIMTPPAAVKQRRLMALDWRAQLAASEKGAQAGCLSVGTAIQGLATDECVLSNECSTVGDINKAVPAEYPLEHSDPTPNRLRITSIRYYLRCRPAELYISSFSYQQELQLLVLCDIRSYDEALVREWLSNVGQAAEWYLGGIDPALQTTDCSHAAKL